MQSLFLKKLRACQKAEIQAVAIYRVEIFLIGKFDSIVGKKRLLPALQTVLLQEQEHQNEMRGEFRVSLIHIFSDFLNLLGGGFIGAVFSVLPQRWFLQVHVWAERQAAQIYIQALAHNPPARYRAFLGRAIDQEMSHAQIFSDLLGRF